MRDVINILSASSAGDLRLRLRFDDDTEQIVDFRPFLATAKHPQVRSWMVPDKFAQFRIEYGELVWGDYELCFPIADLYRNCLIHDLALADAA
jgi:hypothetical protein